MTGPQLVWFDRFDGVELACVGGKSASLGQMAGAGLPVPPGFAITSHVFRAARESSGTADVIRAGLDGLDPDDTADVSRRALAVRDLIRAWPIPPGTEAGIRAAYRALSQRSGRNRLAVAVRSSATAEDSPEASFAGEYDSYLWIRGGDACWTRYAAAGRACSPIARSSTGLERGYSSRRWRCASASSRWSRRAWPG